MKYLQKAIFTAVILLCATVQGYSHPHTFIDAKVECEFNSDGLKGFWINWTFDQMFTASIIMDYDLDRDGSFSEAEILDLEENAFSNLINYNYFIYLTEDKKTIRPDKVTDFTASIIGKDILYRFFVPYSSVLNEKGNTVILAIYDETFFCDIALKSENNVKNNYAKTFDISLHKRKNKEKTIKYDNAFQSITRDGAVYSGFINPDELVVEFR